MRNSHQKIFEAVATYEVKRAFSLSLQIGLVRIVCNFGHRDLSDWIMRVGSSADSRVRQHEMLVCLVDLVLVAKVTRRGFQL